MTPVLWSVQAGAVYALARSVDFVFAGGAGKAVSVYDIPTGQLLPLTIRLPHSIYCFYFDEVTNTLRIGTSSGAIHVVDLQHKCELRCIQWHKNGVYDLCSADNFIASGGGDGRLCLFDKSQMEPLLLISASTGKVRRLLHLPMLQAIAVADHLGCIKFFSLPDLKEIFSISVHLGGVYSLCLHPNRRVLISGGKDGQLRFFDLESNFKEVLSLPVHKGSVYDISYGEGRFATAGRDKVLKIWDSEFNPVARFDARQGAHTHSVNRCIWIGKDRLVSVGDDRKVMGYG